jgi:hypothetical protein
MIVHSPNVICRVIPSQPCIGEYPMHVLRLHPEATFIGTYISTYIPDGIPAVLEVVIRQVQNLDNPFSML